MINESRNPMFVALKHEQFLSEEDLDIENLSFEELISTWNWWLSMMQSTNEMDEDDYSHGVFRSDKQKREIWGEDWEKVLGGEIWKNKKDAE